MSDDTGICEQVMTSEARALRGLDTVTAKAAEGALLASGGHGRRSPDISVNVTDVVGDRYRSATTRRLQQLQQNRRRSSHTTRVLRLISTPAVKSDCDVSKLFVKSTVSESLSTDPDKESELSRCLRLDSLQDNPFSEYVKFDGRAQTNVATRRMKVFVHSSLQQPPPLPASSSSFAPRSSPMSVVCLSSASVSDCIGYICWLYTSEQRQPPLPGGVTDYSLCMAEDDGSVDWDFPPLDDRDSIGKFGFTLLALVPSEKLKFQIDIDSAICETVDTVTVLLDKRSLTVMQVILTTITELGLTEQLQRDTLCLKRVVSDGEEEQVVLPGTDLTCPHYSHLLLTKQERGVTCLEHAQGGDRPVTSLISSMAATVYQSFQVNLLTRWSLGSPVQLGVSVHCVIIDPLIRGRARALFTRPSAGTHQIRSVVDCRIVDVKYGERAIFRIVVVSKKAANSYRRLNFESDIGAAKAIVKKLRSILDFVNSDHRRLFLEEKRSQLQA